MQYSTGEPDGAGEPAGAQATSAEPTGDAVVSDLAVQLGQESAVAKLQDRCIAQAVEAAQADLAAAKTCLSSALARVERCQDDLAEARRMLGRRAATQWRISILVAALVAACSEETGVAHGTNHRHEPDDLSAASDPGLLARHAGPA